MLIVKFKRWNCNVEFAKYNNGRTAIQLTEVETGEPIAVATVNVPDWPTYENHVIIKDWSENEGMYDVLHEAGIVGSIITLVPTGYVNGKLCELLIDIKNGK